MNSVSGGENLAEDMHTYKHRRAVGVQGCRLRRLPCCPAALHNGNRRLSQLAGFACVYFGIGLSAFLSVVDEAGRMQDRILFFPRSRDCGYHWFRPYNCPNKNKN
jgi:hypothetical protein